MTTNIARLSTARFRICGGAGFQVTPSCGEASRLPKPIREDSDELLLDLGVWLGWSTRLISDASDRTVCGFDTFTGLVEDWHVDDQTVFKRGTFSLSEPLAERFITDTGVTMHDGVPAALGRKVQFIRGSTYETLAPFLADRPAAPIMLFHMDLDTYESSPARFRNLQGPLCRRIHPRL